MATETSFSERDAASPRDSARPRIERLHTPGLEMVEIRNSRISEIHYTVTARDNEAISDVVLRLAGAMNAREATLVRLLAFGPLAARLPTVTALRQALDDSNIPLTWVEGANATGQGLAGFQAHGVVGANVQTLALGGGATGRVWSDATAAYCSLSGLGPNRTSATRTQQTRETFENLQAGLAQAGMTIKHLARTWFYLDEILDWYGGFNRVRNDFFEQSELRPGSFPASTGVGGRNAAQAALTAAAGAVKAHDKSPTALEVVPSPRQCPAPAYGSAFSRAVEIRSAGLRQLLISGTASVAPSGETAHVGDIRAQVELSMQVVCAILKSRHMSLADVSRATAYFKSPTDAPVFAKWLAKPGLSGLPLVNARCDICRDDLLFEIEMDAIAVGD